MLTILLFTSVLDGRFVYYFCYQDWLVSLGSEVMLLVANILCWLGVFLNFRAGLKEKKETSVRTQCIVLQWH